MKLKSVFGWLLLSLSVNAGVVVRLLVVQAAQNNNFRFWGCKPSNSGLRFWCAPALEWIDFYQLAELGSMATVYLENLFGLVALDGLRMDLSGGMECGGGGFCGV